ncbi:MAG: Na(+)-translocating NADH-quinone reductase subunit C [Oligoflexales bacterium]
MHKDSVMGTIGVAALLCIACSLMVSTAAVVLKEKQDLNKQLDVKKNILLASGLLKSTKVSAEEVLEAYKSIQAEVVNLETGEVVSDMAAEDFDQRKARKDPKTNKMIHSQMDTAGIKIRSRYSTVYKVMKGDEVTMLILPVNGKGLWSTLYGFVALKPDTTTLAGIGFYEHGETPGLGGEVDNPLWKNQWKGKTALDEDFNPVIQVQKGQVLPDDPKAHTKVDGLSGATITANGVTGLVQYWLGQDGFGPYLNHFRASRS